MKILAVTACHLGIVYTYLAREALEIASKKLGVDIKVETQGSCGIENEITKEDIINADVVILPSVEIENEYRFDHLPIINASVEEIISNPEDLIYKALLMLEDVKGN